jgi:carbonic anhydrase
MGHLSTLLHKIKPAVQEEATTTENRNSGNAEFVENVAKLNVRKSIQEILNRSTILKEMVEAGKIGICGGMYDVATGVVEFYEETVIGNQPKATELMNA